jgi:ABC-type oligopeptide transport system substrate-binding subunit
MFWIQPFDPPKSHRQRLSVALLPVLMVLNLQVFAVDLDTLEFSHGISIFGELKYPAGFTHFEYLNPDAPKGGKLVLSYPIFFDTLAPNPLGWSAAPTGYHLANDPLMVRGGDELAAFYGRLAEGIAVTDDRMTLVFKIHAHAKWDDGEPITANDVVFTFDPPGNIVQPFFNVFETVTALDDRHVAFRLNAPLSYDHITSIQFRPIIPEHYWRDKDTTAATLVPPVTSGPYKVAELKAGRYIVYKRRDDYWGENLPLNRGRYNFDTVRYEVYRDPTVLREAFMKGMVDIIDEDASGIGPRPMRGKPWIKDGSKRSVATTTSGLGLVEHSFSMLRFPNSRIGASAKRCLYPLHSSGSTKSSSTGNVFGRRAYGRTPSCPRLDCPVKTSSRCWNRTAMNYRRNYIFC